MRSVLLVREASTDHGTFGTVLVNDWVAFHSLELPWRDNQRRRSCIPTGDYICRVVRSPRFGRVYHVANVPGRSAILFHSGNFGGNVEKGLQSHIEGCILLGLARGKIRNTSGSPQDAVLLSKPAVRQFMEELAGEPFLLKIRE